MDLMKHASVGLAKRTSRRGIIGRAGKAALGVALVGGGARMAAPATASATTIVDPWEALEVAMEAAVMAESLAYETAADGTAVAGGCCYCWTNCSSCRPGYLAKIYDCPCNPDPNSQTSRIRTVCTRRCCDPKQAC